MSNAHYKDTIIEDAERQEANATRAERERRAAVETALYLGFWHPGILPQEAFEYLQKQIEELQEEIKALKEARR